ncbi:MAG: response regulator [Methylococcaceae bacterium]|nr:response regulator [Methylococcaceae bacterium]
MNAPAEMNDQERLRLDERIRKLASEKAYLELVNQLMIRLSAMPGLEKMVQNMLQSILDTIGGTNVALYYWIDEEIYFADVYGERRRIEAIEDPKVQQAIETRQPEEFVHDLEDSQLMNVALQNAWTWVLPLLVGKDLIGVLKIENLHLGTWELRRYLRSFLTYAAAVLKNEILGHTQLTRVNQELRVANAFLAEARDASESASRAKSAFLANMSHELRTPLNAVLGFTQLLARDDNLAEHQRQNLRIIEHSGQHLLELINDILELSRIEAGRLTLRNVAFNLQSLPATLIEMLHVKAAAKALELRLNCPDDLPCQVEGDSYHLRQVLLNLLGNAIKYTDQGWVALRVHWADGLASFEVADSGRGISPEDQARLFDPFFQADAAKTRSDSTGLGLTIARDYVRLMGGDILVESQVGKGSRFSFSIPLKTIEQPPAETEEAATILGLAMDQPAWRILVVDDDDNNRRYLMQLLAGIGFEVQQAENGSQALELFQYWRPHFIWMDLHMPVMDGLEATRKIRTLPGGGPVQIVILTATAFDQDREKLIAAGADGFLRKPIRINDVFDTLRQRLGAHYVYATAPEPTPTPRVSPEPDAAVWCRIPVPLRDRLRHAAATLDADDVRAVMSEIATAEPELARNIKRYADDYRFEDLLERLEQIPAQG